jgi:CspA family cold shock protein
LEWNNAVMARGTVKQWSDDVGWGVIASDQVPGDVWAHAHMIEGDGFQTLKVGDAVEFAWIQMSKPGEQDGYSYRTTSVRRLDES